MWTGADGRESGAGSRRLDARGAERGFTLVELMVALAVAGLVFFVALPGYRHAVLKSNRIAGKGMLLDIMARQEQFYGNHKRYALTLAELGLPSPLHVDAQLRQTFPGRSVYQIVLEVDEGVFAGARAVPRNRQRRDRQCMALAISRQGVRSVSGALAARPGECW